jgi:hypothetical protein
VVWDRYVKDHADTSAASQVVFPWFMNTSLMPPSDEPTLRPQPEKDIEDLSAHVVVVGFFDCHLPIKVQLPARGFNI